MEVAVLAIIFGSIFGVFYLFFSTRNKERMALIEKGADASIFVKGETSSIAFWKIFLLNISLLLMGIGVGVFIAGFLEIYTNMDSDAIYPATIFSMAGLGLFTGFNLTKKLENN